MSAPHRFARCPRSCRLSGHGVSSFELGRAGPRLAFPLPSASDQDASDRLLPPDALTASTHRIVCSRRFLRGLRLALARRVWGPSNRPSSERPFLADPAKERARVGLDPSSRETGEPTRFTTRARFGGSNGGRDGLFGPARHVTTQPLAPLSPPAASHEPRGLDARRCGPPRSLPPARRVTGVGLPRSEMPSFGRRCVRLPPRASSSCDSPSAAVAPYPFKGRCHDDAPFVDRARVHVMRSAAPRPTVACSRVAPHGSHRTSATP